ncbi:MAG: tetratricopeptide repeat protein [Planctomycetota bacterium]
MSRPLRSLTLAACLACALAPLAPAQGDGQNDAFQRARQTRTKNAAKIRRLILELGDPDFAVREAAREGLRELGSEALPFLEAAQTDADAERAQAAVELTEELRWKIEPGLRDVVGDTLDHWPELAPTARLQGVTFLAERGGARGLPFLVRVARYDADPVVRVAAVDAYCQAAPERTPLDATLLEALADEAPSAQVRWLQSRLLLRGDDPEAGLEAALAAAQDDPQPPPQRLLELIDLLFARGRLDEARPFVEALAARLPEDARVVLRQGELLARDGETEQGLALLERVAQAVEAGQASDRTLIRLGQAYLACGEGEAGDLLYRQALGRNPFRHDLILARGDLALARGDAATALAIYLSEIRYAAPGEPDFTAVCTRLGKLLVDRGAPRFPDDAAFFRDAQRGRPLRAVHATVAAWLLDHGLLAEAAQELRIVAALDPQPAVLRALGDALRDLGDYDGAREAYARALEASPDDRELGGRLESVAGPAPDVAAQDSSGFRVWERRLQGDTQGVGPEAPPPLILGERLLACLPGGIALHAFDAKDGTPRWTHTPKPPTGPEGSLEEQLGWEPVGLYAAPSGAVAATHPGRARDPAPLAAYLLNAYWRPLNRSWRKAKFLGVSLLLLDPETGERLSARELPDLAVQSGRGAGAPRRAAARAQRGQRARQSCELLDAVSMPGGNGPGAPRAWDQQHLGQRPGGAPQRRADRAAPLTGPPSGPPPSTTSARGPWARASACWWAPAAARSWRWAAGTQTLRRPRPRPWPSSATKRSRASPAGATRCSRPPARPGSWPWASRAGPATTCPAPRPASWWPARTRCSRSAACSTSTRTRSPRSWPSTPRTATRSCAAPCPAPRAGARAATRWPSSPAKARGRSCSASTPASARTPARRG